MPENNKQALAFFFHNMRDSIQKGFSINRMIEDELNAYWELLHKKH